MTPTATQGAPPVRERLYSIDPPGLIVGCCAACGTLRFPTFEMCAGCQGVDMEDVVISSEGVIYTFTIVRAAPPGYLGSVPYAIGVVELPEGLRVTATITASDLERVSVGDRVRFELIEVGVGDAAVSSFAYRVATQ